MRPENLEQEGIKRTSLQPQLPFSVHAQVGVPIFHLRYAGLAAFGKGSARVRLLRNAQERQRRVSYFLFY